MLARITYGLVGLALVTLIIGFFQKDSNTWLFISIGLSIAAIVLVFVGAARRAREAPAVDEFEPAFEEAGTEMEEELPADLLTPFDEEEEEEFEEEEEEEEVEIVPPRRAATRKPTATRAPARGAARGATKTAAPSSKVIVVPGRDRYHTASCRFIQGKDGTEQISAATAKRRGYQACSACKPG